MIQKENIRLFDEQEIAAKLISLEEKKFRANQIYHWLWGKRVLDFSNMANLPKDLISKLQEYFDIPTTTISMEQFSVDGTIKVGFTTFDNEIVEGVIIPSDDRITACISSQVGCSLSCKFCATGFLPRKRNLFAFEIYDQVFLLNQLSIKQFGKELTNIVYMGMGEPLLNYVEVVKSLRILNSVENGMGISAKRITVSTSGISRNIKRLADEGLKINLALSLHATNDDKRTQIMEINKSNPLPQLMESLQYFYDKTHNKISYEYILLSGFNDGAADAEELVGLCTQFPVYVNLIEYNAVEGTPFHKSKKENRDQFLQILRNKNISSKVRKSRGKDIDAACGQLANKIVETIAS